MLKLTAAASRENRTLGFHPIGRNALDTGHLRRRVVFADFCDAALDAFSRQSARYEHDEFLLSAATRYAFSFARYTVYLYCEDFLFFHVIIIHRTMGKNLGLHPKPRQGAKLPAPSLFYILYIKGSGELVPRRGSGQSPEFLIL
jgi:hypothetical protein